MSGAGPRARTRPRPRTSFPEERLRCSSCSRLTDEQWGRPTVCSGWSAKDIAAHLLRRRLRAPLPRPRACRRRRRADGRATSRPELLAFINRQNERWVKRRAASAPACCIDLLRWSGARRSAASSRWTRSPSGARPQLGGARAGRRLAGPRPRVHGALAPPAADPRRRRPSRSCRSRRLFAPRLRHVRPLVSRTPSATSTRRDGTHVGIGISGDAGGAWSLVRGDGGWQLCAALETAEPQAAVDLDQEHGVAAVHEGDHRQDDGAHVGEPSRRRGAGASSCWTPSRLSPQL